MKRKSSSWLAIWIIILFISAPTVSEAFLIDNESVWEIIDHDFRSSNTRQYDVEFVNATHGWVLGQNSSGTRYGMILHTNDSGDSWVQQVFNSSQRFTQIEVIDSNTLWVSAIGGLYHTQDGGQFWNITNIGSPDEFFHGIYFLNRTHGWTSSSLSLYKSTDGGENWESVDSWNYDDDRARMFYFVDELEGWVIGFLGIYHTEDGGNSWEKEVSHGGWSFSFVNDNEAWVVADDWLAQMTDGETWLEKPLPRTTPLPTSPPYFSDILFLDTNNGWIVGDETEVAYTPNGGRDWYSQPFPHDNRVSAVDFINVTHGWAVGANGYIYRTTRGNSLGTSLWTGISVSGVILAASVLGIVVIAFSGILAFRKRKRRASGPQQGVELK